MYAVNATPLSVNEKLQLLDLLQTLGPYKSDDFDDYSCTTSMVDRVCISLQHTVSKLPVHQRIGLAMALTRIPMQPVCDIAYQCLADVSQIRFKAVCFEVLQTTKQMSTLANVGMKFLEPSDLPIQLFCRYLLGSHQPISTEMLQRVFFDVSDDVEDKLYTSKVMDPNNVDHILCGNENWVNIELTSCDQTGCIGPTLSDCISSYKSKWVNNPSLFHVEHHGVQQLTIPRDGNYNIIAYGAGWKTEKCSGLGLVFQIS